MTPNREYLSNLIPAPLNLVMSKSLCEPQESINITLVQINQRYYSRYDCKREYAWLFRLVIYLNDSALQVSDK